MCSQHLRFWSCRRLLLHLPVLCYKGTHISVLFSFPSEAERFCVSTANRNSVPACLFLKTYLFVISQGTVPASLFYIFLEIHKSICFEPACFCCIAGDHDRGHGGTAGLWPGQRSCLRCDRRTESAARSRIAGLLQVGEAAYDPYEEPLGREGVERPLEWQVTTVLPPTGMGGPLQLIFSY